MPRTCKQVAESLPLAFGIRKAYVKFMVWRCLRWYGHSPDVNWTQRTVSCKTCQYVGSDLREA